MMTALRVTSILFLVLTFAGPVFASDQEQIGEALQQFLAAADKREAHQRFWAEELVYTSSGGTRFGKADILASFDDVSADVASTVVYSGDQVDIRLYGTTAVVAFRLIATPTGDSADLTYYFNTGTFIKRDDTWTVVAWQATRIPTNEESQ